MEIWWSSLGAALRVFYGIALVTSAALVLQLVLTLFGLDGEGDVDLDTDLDVDGHGGGGILSVRTVTAFFVGFGWTGVAALESGMSLLPAIVLATLVGSAFMAGVFFMMRALYGMRYSGTLDYRNAVGTVGSVYLKIPGRMAGPGQVEVMVQGRLRVAQAFTHAEGELANQARVRVVDVMDQNTLVVEPLEAEGGQSKEG